MVTNKPQFYDSLLASVRGNWDAHDDSCESIPWFWLGRHGGPGTCLSDISSCEDCEVLFYNEGIVWANWDTVDKDEDDLLLCGCCAHKRGFGVKRSEHNMLARA